jgi:ribosomal protein S18 acetylase RimI-like enzyme
LIARARALDVQTLRLEVIEENQHAHALYQQHGFRDVRFLHMLERPLLPPPPPERFGFTITPKAPQTLLSYYAKFHDVRNCWQRDLPSLERLALHSEGRALYDLEEATDEEKRDTPIGYVLGQFTPHSVLMFDMVASPTNRHRHTHTQMLLMHIHHNYPHALGHAYNVAEDDHAIHVYRDLGYQTHLRQIEMELALS